MVTKPPENVVVMANGQFPQTEKPLNILENSSFTVYCDGAAKIERLEKYPPGLIVGDMDSINSITEKHYNDFLFYIHDQNTTDLDKALNWCKENSVKCVTILGGTGNREDHTVANIFLLEKYYLEFDDIQIVSDRGCFKPISGFRSFQSYSGQPVSLFASDCGIRIDTKYLKYPYKQKTLATLFSGISNESTADKFEISVSHGVIIVYISDRSE